ncbi:MAG: pyridoxamine 5'-phosphate oxidase family protein, partial [Chloroflexi bacterium]|nr:pyridoxamine 5'-phosphate oxidase family protein [Chloroflexota bacterium]
MLDLTKAYDAHVDQRLRTEPIIWLNSVRPDGRPHSVPVWFLWDGATFLIFSKPSSQKIRNLRQNKYVTLALDGTDEGG